MRSRLYTIWSFRWKEEGRVDCGGIMIINNDHDTINVDAGVQLEVFGSGSS